MHMLFFFLAAYIACTIYSHLRGEPNKGTDLPQQHRDDWTFITAETVNWKSIYFERICESPAEVGFLTAIISSYQLIPDRGTLKGGGLELQLQIPIHHYRVDFLANRYLVVEIDGAAYHSSPEAVEKDRIRDQFLSKSGYVVLRIPAKIVFNSPSEAVQRVRYAISTLAHERSILANSVLEAQTATLAEEQAKYAEQTAQELSNTRLALEEWKAKSPRREELYNQSLELIQQSIANAKKKNSLLEAQTEDQTMFEVAYAEQKAQELANSRFKIEEWKAKSPRNEELYNQSMELIQQSIAKAKKKLAR